MNFAKRTRKFTIVKLIWNNALLIFDIQS